MGEVKHGDLSIQQIADVQKSILVSLRSKEAFWDKFCSHTTVADGYSSVEWRKLNVKNLKPSEVTDLSEGITPAGLPLEYVKFSVAPVDFGSHIDYTDKAKKYNFDNVVEDAKTVLGQRAFDEVEIRKARQFVSGACTITPITTGDDAFMKTLLKARTILKKNKVKTLRGNMYGCILTPELAADVLVTYKNSITHTSQKEAVINGYIGELGGFILFECADEIMYVPAVEQSGETPAVPAKAYCLFIGKTEYGMPVQTVSIGNASVEIYNNPLGTGTSKDASGNVVDDALHQHGSVGYKCMGFATRILFDEAILRAEYTLDPVALEIDDDDRTGYVSTSKSPNA